MVCRIVVGNQLQGVPGERITAVVVNGLDGRKGKEAHALQRRHARHLEANARAEGVEQEALKWVVVQGAISIGHIQTVVTGVESS